MPFIVVDEEKEGQRLDNYLLSHLKGVPKSLVYRLVRKGTVRVNGKRKDVTYRVLAGDRVWVPALQQSAPKELKGDFSWLLSSICYEDEGLIIIDKPCGLPSHSGSGHHVGLIEAIRQARKDVHYLDLVHRLDKDTSGLIMLAKKRSLLRALQEQRAMQSIEKYYWAVLVGEWPQKSATIDFPVKRLTDRTDKVIVAPDGKEAFTYFKRLQINNGLTLVEAKLGTGRMHQIRVHAKAMGYPLLADEKYNTDTSREKSDNIKVNRLGLHAKKLVLEHTKKKKKLVVESIFPKELAQLFSI